MPIFDRLLGFQPSVVAQGGRVLAVEMLMPSDKRASLAPVMDRQMMCSSEAAYSRPGRIAAIVQLY